MTRKNDGRKDGGLDRTGGINPVRLSGEHYLLSLLMEAARQGLLTGEEQLRLRGELVALAAKRAERFTGGESGSLPVERAQDLLSSILFTIGMALKAQPDPDRALEAVKNTPLAELYRMGLRRVRTRLSAARQAHRMLLRAMVDLPNETYQSTLRQGIAGFFKAYDPYFSAHSVPITADYPTFLPVKDCAGVEFLQRYLGQLYQENRFLLLFPAERIQALLEGMEPDWEKSVRNLYGPVLTTALGCTLAGIPAHSLALAPAQLEELRWKLEGLSRRGVETLLAGSCQQMAGELNIQRESLLRLLERSVPLAAESVLAAMKADRLEWVFGIAAVKRQPDICYTTGTKLSADAYRELERTLTACRYFSDKRALLRRHVSSLEDWIHLLVDGEWSREERLALLAELTPPDQAAILRFYTVPQEEIEELPPGERDFQLALAVWLDNLPPARRKALEMLSARLLP